MYARRRARASGLAMPAAATGVAATAAAARVEAATAAAARVGEATAAAAGRTRRCARMRPTAAAARMRPAGAGRRREPRALVTATARARPTAVRRRPIRRAIGLLRRAIALLRRAIRRLWRAIRGLGGTAPRRGVTAERRLVADRGLIAVAAERALVAHGGRARRTCAAVDRVARAADRERAVIARAVPRTHDARGADRRVVRFDRRARHAGGQSQTFGRVLEQVTADVTLAELAVAREPPLRVARDHLVAMIVERWRQMILAAVIADDRRERAPAGVATAAAPLDRAAAPRVAGLPAPVTVEPTPAAVVEGQPAPAVVTREVPPRVTPD